MFSGMSKSSTAALLPGWLLASFLGGLISILVSRLELSSASRLRAAAFSEAVLSEESCPGEILVSRANKTIRNRIRTISLYRFRERSKQPYERQRQWKRTPAISELAQSPVYNGNHGTRRQPSVE